MIGSEHIDAAFVCDAGHEVGVGHVMRSLALAEELIVRGQRVAFFADLGDLPWVEAEVRRRGPRLLPRPPESGLMEGLRAAAPRCVVFDSYSTTSEFLRVARSHWRTLAMIDGAAGQPEAHVVVDANLGAESVGHSPVDATLLAGVRYALIRDDVLAHRPAKPPSADLKDGEPPQLLVVVGGTDPQGVAPQLVALLARLRLECRLSVISSRTEDELVGRAERRDGLAITVLPPGTHYPQMVLNSDLVISAAGSTTWELLTLGACAALIQVADNQALGYGAAVRQGLAAGLGSARDLGDSAHFGRAAATVTSLLTEPLTRSLLRRRAWMGVDGQGRQRVADALLRDLS